MLGSRWLKIIHFIGTLLPRASTLSRIFAALAIRLPRRLVDHASLAAELYLSYCHQWMGLCPGRRTGHGRCHGYDHLSGHPGCDSQPRHKPQSIKKGVSKSFFETPFQRTVVELFSKHSFSNT